MGIIAMGERLVDGISALKVNNCKNFLLNKKVMEDHMMTMLKIQGKVGNGLN